MKSPQRARVLGSRAQAGKNGGPNHATRKLPSVNLAGRWDEAEREVPADGEEKCGKDIDRLKTGMHDVGRRGDQRERCADTSDSTRKSSHDEIRKEHATGPGKRIDHSPGQVATRNVRPGRADIL